MIKMSKLVGMSSSTLREALEETDQMVGLTQKESLNKDSLKKMVRSEYLALLGDVQSRYPEIQEKLEMIRKEMFKEYFKRQKMGNTYLPVLEKRIQTQVVSELIEVPVNELVLYAVNCLKTVNEDTLVEYHLGHFRFKCF